MISNIYEIMDVLGNITVSEAKTLLRVIEPAALYLEKLHQRLQTLGMPVTDPYFIRVKAAATEMQSLRAWTFYMTFDANAGDSDG